MSNEICKKISSMLSLYIDNKVNYSERAFIENHLSVCEECYKKYLYLRSLIRNLKESYKQILEITKLKQKKAYFNIKEHQKFQDNISPYIDNELPAEDCIEFRQYLIKSPSAQNELRKAYSLQKELKKTFQKSQKSQKIKLQEKILRTIKPQTSYWDKINIVNPRRLVKTAILTGLIFFGGTEIKKQIIFINNTKPASIEKEEAGINQKINIFINKINLKKNHSNNSTTYDKSI